HIFQRLKPHRSRALNCILESMEAMNMKNESRRASPKLDGADGSKIKGASVYLHDQEVEAAISASIFEDGSRPEVRHRTATFLRLPRLFSLIAAAKAIS